MEPHADPGNPERNGRGDLDLDLRENILLISIFPILPVASGFHLLSIDSFRCLMH